MGAFILAGLIVVGTVGLAFIVAFAEGMATAPHYSNTPIVILVVGGILAALAVASHWFPHIGW